MCTALTRCNMPKYWSLILNSWMILHGWHLLSLHLLTSRLMLIRSGWLNGRLHLGALLRTLLGCLGWCVIGRLRLLPGVLRATFIVVHLLVGRVLTAKERNVVLVRVHFARCLNCTVICFCATKTILRVWVLSLYLSACASYCLSAATSSCLTISIFANLILFH